MAEKFEISKVANCGDKVFLNGVFIGNIQRWTEEGCAVRLPEKLRTEVRAGHLITELNQKGLVDLDWAMTTGNLGLSFVTDTIIVSNEQFEAGIYTVEGTRGK